MGLNAADLENMTLGDIEAIAKRTREAAETLTQALSLLRGAAPPLTEAQQEFRAQVGLPSAQRPPSPAIRLSPAEQAEKERLLRNMRPELPADIAAAEAM